MFIVYEIIIRFSSYKVNKAICFAIPSYMMVAFGDFVLSSIPAHGDFYLLLITFANSLDPDQAQ